MDESERFKHIYYAAENYLLGFPEIDEAILERHISLENTVKPSSIEELFRSLLGSMSSRRGMRNSIGEIDKLAELLFDFDPRAIHVEYGNDWKQLFRDIQESEFRPPTYMNINRSRSYWVIFTRGIISGADYLSSFGDAEGFHRVVEHFYSNNHSRIALPLYIEKEIFGMGFATACSFLMENGYPNYVKPDTHLKDIFHGLGVSESKDDYTVFKDVINYSQTIHQSPYTVDKLFWLVGSGRFNKSDTKINTNKNKFIDNTREQLDS